MTMSIVGFGPKAMLLFLFAGLKPENVSNRQVLGDTMARCYIKFETMQKFAELKKTTTLSELVV
jgi:hypothetical protein